ncbi:2-keto-3-deoxy-d-arabino-heptulosonate-7- phosphate synthase i beta [hydrocarbon metagenome]|uniref:2-keto-3-deoxy-d-arabino-heptulosonate-7-phosphate synthase i beta n=1 Tax=hydrocarbon metagenome TaxID=938273 RepID=A0A0W8E3K2_9ZZZZ
MEACRLAVRDNHPMDTIINIPGKADSTRIGKGYCTVIAGPCAVESPEKYLEIALQVKKMGAHVLRGGAFKPRTSPYSFAGLGIQGLKILEEAREITGLPVITELMDIRDLDQVCRYSDIIQIGSRNMQNFSLLREVGRVNKPVMVKRGLSATIEEWLLAAEYVLCEGNREVILCERGIRTFEGMTRNTVDIGQLHY